MPPTVSVTGWYFRCGHVGTGEDPEVLGDVHPIFSCNSFIKDYRSCCWQLLERPSAGLWALRTVFLINLKKTSWRAESRIGCRLAQCFEFLDIVSSPIVFASEVSL